MRIAWMLIAGLVPALGLAETITVDPTTTISAAVDRAKPGNTILVRPGVYRENVRLRRSGTPDAPIRFVAEKPGSVVITGADMITNFQRVDGNEPIHRVAWPHVFAIDHRDGKAIEYHPESAPLWGRAEQVIADERLLLPCKDVNDLRAAWKDREKRLQSPVKNLGGPFAGMFTVDTTNHALYLWLADGSDPNAHAMQASTRSQLFGLSELESRLGVHDVQVSGFVFRYAANFPQRAAVVLHGSNNTIDHCVIEKISGTGVSVAGTMRNCLIRDNGFCGGAVEGDDFLVERSVWENNCWKPIDRSWESGGAKVCDSRRGQFRDCIFRRNGGPGLWFDIDCRDITVSNCAFMQNELSGLFIEISRGFTVENNLAYQNAIGTIGQVRDADWSVGGIQIAESSQCTVRSNTCIDNRDGITLREIGPRDVTTRGEKSVYHNTDNSITNNTITNSREYAIALWWDNAFFGASGKESYDPRQQKLTIDGNIFDRDAKFLYGAPWLSGAKQLSKLEDFRATTGFEEKGKVSDQSISPSDGIDDRIKLYAPF